MAKNLRAKVPKDDQLVIFDRNKDVTTQLMHEYDHLDSNPASRKIGKNLKVANTAREVVERSVSPAFHHPRLKSVFHMMSVFYR